MKTKFYQSILKVLIITFSLGCIANIGVGIYVWQKLSHVHLTYEFGEKIGDEVNYGAALPASAVNPPPAPQAMADHPMPTPKPKVSAKGKARS